MILRINKYKSLGFARLSLLVLSVFSVIHVFGLFILVPQAYAQGRVVNYDASDLLPKSEIKITPPTGTFEEGSTFDVPIFINTLKSSVNAIDLRIKFNPDTLSVVRPSGGKSIIGLWVEPPTYDNTFGTVKIVGAIPGGIKSNSGLIVTVTFKAIKSGQATVEIRDSSQVLLDDGAGTPTIINSNRGAYTILPKPPGGVVVFSDTHPFQDRWYNNPNPVMGWNKDLNVSGFSYVLDKQPNTVPPNKLMTASTSVAFQDLQQGLSYFHIKSMKDGVWGAATEYILRIDTEPPANFTPKIDYLTASVVNRLMVSFFTTDSLSGVSHYEVGVIDKSGKTTESPVFIETESPYQLPITSADSVRILVRAYDNAGNIREASIDAKVPFFLLGFLYKHLTLILILVLLLFILAVVVHYFYGHHLNRKIQEVMDVLKRQE